MRYPSSEASNHIWNLRILWLSLTNAVCHQELCPKYTNRAAAARDPRQLSISELSKAIDIADIHRSSTKQQLLPRTRSSPVQGRSELQNVNTIESFPSAWQVAAG